MNGESYSIGLYSTLSWYQFYRSAVIKINWSDEKAPYRTRFAGTRNKNAISSDGSFDCIAIAKRVGMQAMHRNQLCSKEFTIWKLKHRLGIAPKVQRSINP